MRAPPRWRTGGALALLAILVVPAISWVPGGRVLGHAQLVASSPGSGVVLPQSPEEIRLVFSEPLERQLTSVDVAREDGSIVLARAGTIDPDDPFALVLNPPDLGDGIYVLTWRTLSAADGHTAEGFLTFGVGEVDGVVASQPGEGMLHAETDPIAVVGRWLTYLGLLLALGMAVFSRAVMRSAMPEALRRVLAMALLLSGTATLVAAAASGLEAGSITDYLSGSRNGALQLARAVVGIAGGGCLLLVPTRRAGGIAEATGLAGIVLLIVAGHAAALPGPVPTVGGVVHVVGAAVWIGGVAGLLALAVRPVLVSDGPVPAMREVVPRFSALALASIGIVVLTGVYAAYVQTGTLLDPGTEYGRTLLMKTAFAVGALALGGLNYLDGGRMMGWLDGFRSRITVEALLIATVLVLTAALAITPPVDEPSGVAIEPLPDAFGDVAPGMTMRLVPGRPGLNRVVVTTTDALAASAAMELALDRLDEGSTTRLPLLLEGMAGMDHETGTAGQAHTTEDGTVDWTADAVVLPPSSRWDTSVRVLSASGDAEISRQRFAFAFSEDAVSDGDLVPLLDPATVVAAALLLGGALGVGLGLGGGRLPRCERTASRIALIGGGTTGAVMGGLIGAARLIGSG